MRYARLAGVAFLAIVLVACGGSSSNGLASKSADEIHAAMVDAFKNVESVHLYGDFMDEGEPLELDLQITSTGDASGSILYHGSTFYLIRAGGEIYMKAEADVWEKLSGSAEAAVLLADKWLKVPPGEYDFGGFEELSDLTNWADQLESDSELIKQAGTKTINGKKTIVLEDASDDGLLYVAAKGMPYPLRIEGGTGGGQSLDFFDYDEPVTITAPEGAIDVAKLKAAATH